MFVTLLFLIASISSLSYREGETFQYNYHSQSKQLASQDSNEDTGNTFTVDALAKFKVLKVSQEGAYLELTISNMAGVVTDGTNSENVDATEYSEEYYGNPIYFTQQNDGSIKDVIRHEEDDDETVTMKSSVLYALQSYFGEAPSPDYVQKSVVDPQGAHYQFFQTTNTADGQVVKSRYTENDFTSFVDGNVTKEDLAIDSTAEHTVSGGKITKAVGQLHVVLNKNQQEGVNSEDDPLVEFVMDGDHSLQNFAQGNDEEVEAIESVEAFLLSHPHYKREEKLSLAWHMHRKKPRRDLMENEANVRDNSCPGNINLCKEFQKTWTVGNSNVGLSFSVSGIAGLTWGCTDPSRSYMIGAYADVNILIIGRTVSAISAYAEYGQVSGSPLKNAVEVKLFGYVLYHKDFPFLDCISKSYQLANWDKDFSFKYTIVVYIVTITFSVGLELGFTAQLNWIICPMQLNASITFTPRGSVSLHGGAEVSIVVAKAGIEIRGTVADYLDPTAYIDGNLCRVGFRMYNNLEPIDCILDAYWQTRSISFHHWHLVIGWGSKHSYTIWHHTWSGRRDKIIDVYWGAK